MKLQQLLEMTQTQAVEIFAKHGERLNGASSDDVKRARNRLVRKFQADLARGGESDLKLINAAYDVLKSGVPVSPVNPTRQYSNKNTTWDDSADRRRRADAEEREWRNSRAAQPQWAKAGGNTDSANIYRNDFTDINYIRRTMWELSRASTEEWTIWGFDGFHFRGVVTVYGNSKIFKKMAEAMYVWQTQGGNPHACRAVFVSNKANPKRLYLIYADDQLYADDPIVYAHDSFNSNPGNDQAFVRGLPDELDKLANEE